MSWHGCYDEVLHWEHVVQLARARVTVVLAAEMTTNPKQRRKLSQSAAQFVLDRWIGALL